MSDCSKCNEYLERNFCADCGRRIIIKNETEKDVAEMSPDEIKQGIKNKIIGMQYLTIKVEHRNPRNILNTLVPILIDEIDEKINKINKDLAETKNKNPNFQYDCHNVIINYLEGVSYAKEFESIFEKIDGYLKSRNTFIIDLTKLEVNKVIQVNNNGEKFYISVIIKDLEIYTKEEYEEKVYPFLQYCPNWLDNSFKYRERVNNDYPLDSKCEKMIPFIKNKIYLISTTYSKMINNYIEKKRKEHGYEKYAKERQKEGKINLSGFLFNFETVGKVNEKYAHIVLAALLGLEIELNEKSDNKSKKISNLKKSGFSYLQN